MARERMVTRSVEVTVCKTICMNVSTVETVITDLELTGKVTPDNALKLLKKNYETDTFKVVAITDTTTREDMYGMLEVDFIKSAKKLDPATRKMIETDN